MMPASRIEWTDETINPVTGCTKVSEGCENCYAERMARRLQKIGEPAYVNGFKVTLHPKRLSFDHWKKPHRVFLCSMGDLFHDDVPVAFIQDTFAAVSKRPHLTFQLLTKRPERMLRLNRHLRWPPNLWMGVSIELEKYMERITPLMCTKAALLFASMEPLLGPVEDLSLLRYLDWVIVGGESGPRARPMEESWVIPIQNECKRLDIPFFFKQWGGRGRGNKGKRVLLGRTWNEFPRSKISTSVVERSHALSVSTRVHRNPLGQYTTAIASLTSATERTWKSKT